MHVHIKLEQTYMKLLEVITRSQFIKTPELMHIYRGLVLNERKFKFNVRKTMAKTRFNQWSFVFFFF